MYELFSVLRLYDFPIGVFANNFAVAKFQKVTTTNFNFLAILGCTRQIRFMNSESKPEGDGVAIDRVLRVEKALSQAVV